MRLETLDALDKLPQLVNSDELKIKLLFSVMVVSAFFAKQMPIPVKNVHLCLIKTLKCTKTLTGGASKARNSESIR